MDEELTRNQFIAGEPAASGDVQYLRWIEDVKSRYRQSQIKAHLQVNAAVLEFNWYLGHDISEIMRTRIWGSGVLNQVSLDLRAASPESKGFSRANLYRMGRFYGFYAGQKEIVAQVVRQLQPIENKENTFVVQVVPQIKEALVVDADSAPVDAFPYFRSKEVYTDLQQTKSVIQNAYIMDFTALVEDANSRNETFLKILQSNFKRTN